jgi:oxepin-CoA hydrolase/3-oxo-5,6-dehydrosuberyl-CoA semialdehyde dehydrogenase
MEADSLNCCVLGDDVTPAQPEFALFIREVVREMTAKAGQNVPPSGVLSCRRRR